MILIVLTVRVGLVELALINFEFTLVIFIGQIANFGLIFSFFLFGFYLFFTWNIGVLDVFVILYDFWDLILRLVTYLRRNDNLLSSTALFL